MPTTWDETRFLQGGPAEYVVVARRKGETWYIGAMTDEQPRGLDVALDFLASGTSYQAQVFQDSDTIEHEHLGIDVRTTTHDRSDTVSLSLAGAGGAVVVLRPSSEAP
jgi:alpha-glucosidase